MAWFEGKQDGRIGKLARLDVGMQARMFHGGLPLDIDLLEASFAAVAPRGDELVEYFYDQLFDRYPEVVPLFENADMQKQQGELLAVLTTVVGSLRTPDKLVSQLQQLHTVGKSSVS